MKYLKMFEDNQDDLNKYNEGDYVLIPDTSYFKYFFHIYNEKNITLKILEPDYDRRTDRIVYSAIAYNGEEHTISEEDILRKATKEDIKKYKLLKSTSKFNI